MSNLAATGKKVRCAALIAAGFFLSACSSSSDLFGPSTAAPGSNASGSFRERMNAMLFGGPPTPAPATAASGGAAEIDCPPVEIRQGTSTLSAAAGAEPTATNLRYQVSIGQTARECAVLGATFTVKVGVQGRVALGPAGSPGSIEIPLRVALVREGIEPKTVWTKLYRVPVTIQPGQTNIPFLHVEEDLTVPVPSGADLDAYVVYVGFDPLAAKEPRKPAKKQKPKA